MTTLWLTRIRIDDRSRIARADLADADRLHRRLMTLMPHQLHPEQPRRAADLLYRIDDTRDATIILAQSAIPPDPERLPERYGHIATRPLRLDTLHAGQPVRYRIAGNACKRLARGDHAGKLAALHGADAEQWWLTRAAQHGLHITAMTAHPQAAITGHRRNTPAGDRIRHNIIRYDGTATITDTTALQHALQHGIGRGKAHGCGLLSLAPHN